MPFLYQVGEHFLKNILNKALYGFLRFFAFIEMPFFRTKNKVYKNEASSKKHLAFTAFLCGIVTIIPTLFVFLACCTRWIYSSFGKVGISAILFTLKYANSGITAKDMLLFSLNCLIVPILFYILFFKFIFKRSTLKSYSKKLIFKKSGKLSQIDFECEKAYKLKTSLFTLVCAATALVYTNYSLSVIQYIKNQFSETTIYEDYYIKPTDEVITFPEQKRNLIYIYLESMENTYVSYGEGGGFDENYMSGLTELAKNNTSFSNTDKLGGANYFSEGMSYTMGGFVSQTAGIPLYSPILKRNKLDKFSDFLPGVRTLEDILHEQGYNQLMLQGSPASFAGCNNFYGKYDNSRIIDYDYAKENGLIPEDYFVFWGYEDKRLIEFAKDEITKMSSQSEPFAVTMFTIDTHRPNGYKCELCEDNFDSDYANAIDCSSRQIVALVDWLKQQDFYDNTTIIITGDHLSMNDPFFKHLDDDYVRTTYNVIINAPVSTDNVKNRTFMSIDMFPTTLACLGAEIKGDRLGLGTNLFSSTPTLAEQMGGEKLVTELNSHSAYYEKEFWFMD